MDRSIVFGVCLLAVAGCKWPEGKGASGEFGCFEGKVVAVWDDPGRTMTLQEDFAYIDARKKRWVAPKGSITDGASIPRPFWSLIGGPFEGRYRSAAVVHDVACRQKSDRWDEVHRMFYEACRCGGVEERLAKLLYWAVYHYGPQWESAPKNKLGLRAYARIVPPDLDDDLARRVKEYIEANNPSLAQIESLTVPPGAAASAHAR